MPVADYAQNVQTPFFPMVRHAMDWKPGKSAASVASTAKPSAAAKPADTTATASKDSGDGKSFWQDVLDVVNPLQHLPVIGTVYRAITGDKIGDVEKIAGDTLYGGPLGLASSLADFAFEKLTGKDFGDTVMGFVGVGGDGAPAAPTALADKALKPLPPRVTAAPAQLMAAAAPAVPPAKKDAPTAAPQIPTLTDSQSQALMAAMNQNGVNSDLGIRALFAYQKSLGLSSDADGASPAP
jgi:hypothetical protein